VRESVEQKAARYLAEGRVLLERVDEAGVRALVAGDSATHEVVATWGMYTSPTFGEDGWSCSCPASISRCSHVVACELVTGGAARRGEGAPTT
jgi:uncharacterized Zn finger protein